MNVIQQNAGPVWCFNCVGQVLPREHGLVPDQLALVLGHRIIAVAAGIS